jgi:hypothetical protein
MARWSGVVEEEGSLRVETLQLVLGRLKALSTESQSIPRKVKLVMGMRLDFSQLMMKPTFINSERASCRLDKQIWKEDPKTKMSSR